MRCADELRRLVTHAQWADRRLLDAVRSSPADVPEALRELAHVMGATEVWLARLEGRVPRSAVWPAVSSTELEGMLEATHRAYGRYVAALQEDDLDRTVTYTNSAGQTFSNTVADILLHVALHGQYHRGKANQLLRQCGAPPAPADYIAFVRGAPAATEATARETRGSG